MFKKLLVSLLFVILFGAGLANAELIGGGGELITSLFTWNGSTKYSAVNSGVSQICESDGTTCINLSGTGISTTPAGSNDQIQLNINGALGTNTGFSFTGATNTLFTPNMNTTGGTITNLTGSTSLFVTATASGATFTGVDIISNLSVLGTTTSNNLVLTGTGGGTDFALTGTLTVDTISENTSGNGVDIDSVKLRDGGLQFGIGTGSEIRSTGAVIVGDDIVNTSDNRTLVLSDNGKYIRMNSGASLTATFPNSGSVALPLGTVVDIFRLGTGSLTLTGASSVTFNAQGLTISNQFGGASCKKVGDDEWDCVGDL